MKRSQTKKKDFNLFIGIFWLWQRYIPRALVIWNNWSMSESPGNKGSPVTTSYNKQPTAHISTALKNINI